MRAWYCAAVVVLLFVGAVAQGPSSADNDQLPPIPGSCYNDTMCSPGQFCSADGMCVEKDLLFLPPVRKYRTIEAMGYALFAGFCGFWVIACITYVAFGPSGAWWDGPENTREAAWQAVAVNLITSLIASMVITLAVGLSIGFVQTTPTPPAGDPAAAMCSSLYALSCGPYSCDLALGRCRSSCRGLGECAAGYRCENNVCSVISYEAQESYPWVVAVMIGICVAMICSALACYVTFIVAANESRFEMSCGPSTGLCMCCFVVCFLIVGLPIMFAAKGNNVAWYDGNIQTQGLTSRRISTGAIIATCVVIPLILLFVMIFTGMPCILDHLEGYHNVRDFRNAFPPFYITTAFCCCFIVAMVIGASTAFNPFKIDFLEPGNGAACTVHAGCTPFWCDLTAQKCRTQCNTDDECQLGYMCEAGVCNQPTTPNERKKFTGGEIAGALIPTALFGSAFFFALCTGLYECINRHSGAEDFGRLCYVFCCIVISLSIGLGMGLAKITDPVGAKTINCTVAAASACQPYRCDLMTHSCITKCLRDEQCIEGTVCSAGGCIPKDEYDPSQKLKLGWQLGMPITFLAAFLCCIGIGIHTARYLREYARAAQNQGERELNMGFGFGNGGLYAGVLLILLGAVLTQVDGTPTTQLSCKQNQDCARGYECDGALNLCKPTDGMPNFFAGRLVAAITILGALMLSWAFAQCIGMRIAIHKRRANGYVNWEATFFAMFFIGFLIMLIVCGLVSGLIKSTTPRYTPPTIAVNASSCVAAASAVCEPFYCDTYAGKCRSTCTEDYECIDGFRCQQSTNMCIAAIYTQVLQPRWIKFTVATVTLLGGVVLSMVINAYWGLMGGSQLSINLLCVGDIISSVVGGLCSLVTAAILAASISMALLYKWYIIVPPFSGAGPACTGAVSPTCFPYYCDSAVNQCFTQCSRMLECMDGYDCLSGRCVENSENLQVAVAVAGSLFVVLGIMATLGPKIRMALNRTRYARMRRQAAEVDRQKAAADAIIARAKADHPMILDVEPGAIMLSEGVIRDPTLPTPQGWALDPTFNPSPFEAALDQAFTGVAPVGAVELSTLHAERRGSVGVGSIAPGPLVPGTGIRRGPGGRPMLAISVPDSAAETPTGGVTNDLPSYDLAMLQDAANPFVAEPSIRPMRVAYGVGAGDGPKPGLILKQASTDALCCVCFSDEATVRFVDNNCRHGYCGTCASFSLQAMMDEGQFPARCPGCRAEDPNPSVFNTRSFIPAGAIEWLMRRKLVAVELGRRIINMMVLRAFAPHEVITCPVCFMINTAPDLTAKERMGGRDPLRVQCAECTFAFCCKCNVLYKGHEGLTCDQYAKKQASNETRLTASIIANTSKPCPSCGTAITHYRNHACHHISPGRGCPNCGVHFCYVCLNTYPCSGIGHSLFCDEAGLCGCPICPDCKPGRACPHCDGNCPSCRGVATA